MSNNLLKCPDRYVSFEYLRDKLPQDCKIKSYALKSGHIELSLYHNGYDIIPHTNRYFVYEFWKCINNSHESLYSTIKYFHKNLSISDIGFYRDNWYYHFDDPYERAAIFYLLNRYSMDGSLNCIDISKHNFSKLNLLEFEKLCPHIKSLNFCFDGDENLINCFNKVPEDNIIIVPVGKMKRTYLLKKNIITIDKSTFNHENLKSFIDSQKIKCMLIYKYDKYVDKFYENNKTYINKLGFVTENPELAEDLIVSNF